MDDASKSRSAVEGADPGKIGRRCKRQKKQSRVVVRLMRFTQRRKKCKRGLSSERSGAAAARGQNAVL